MLCRGCVDFLLTELLILFQLLPSSYGQLMSLFLFYLFEPIE